MLDGFVELLRQGAANAASGAVRQRLEEMAVFNKTIRVAMDDALSRWRAQAALTMLRLLVLGSR